MKSEITRAAFDKLPPEDKRAALKTHTLIDPPEIIKPDGTRLVYTNESGEKRLFTRQTFDALPVNEKSKLGRHLKVEYIEPNAATDKRAGLVEYGTLILEKLKREAIELEASEAAA